MTACSESQLWHCALAVSRCICVPASQSITKRLSCLEIYPRRCSCQSHIFPSLSATNVNGHQQSGCTAAGRQCKCKQLCLTAHTQVLHQLTLMPMLALGCTGCSTQHSPLHAATPCTPQEPCLCRVTGPQPYIPQASTGDDRQQQLSWMIWPRVSTWRSSAVSIALRRQWKPAPVHCQDVENPHNSYHLLYHKVRHLLTQLSTTCYAGRPCPTFTPPPRGASSTA